MSRTDLAQHSCTLARTIELIGDAWSLMILREMFLGGRRFDDLQRLTGASPHILSQRLKRLEREGVLRRETYNQHPPRHEYRLTESGRDLWPVIVSLKQWGDSWLEAGDTPVAIIHKGCDHTVTPQMTCPECREPMAAHDAQPVLSPEFAAERAAARRKS
jgi:DNA-binding HxlR family transcriptional regulator